MLLNKNANIFGVAFKRYLVIRIWISSLMIILGIIMLTLIGADVYKVFQDIITSKETSFVLGVYSGMGTALVVLGVVGVIRSRMILKQPDKYKPMEIEYNDERSRFIATKMFGLATYIFLFLLLVGVIISGMINFVVFITLLCTLISYAIILMVTGVVIHSRY